MNEAYRKSNQALAKKLLELPNYTEMYRQLATWSEKHPQLFMDISREVIALYSASFPKIEPVDLLTTATKYVDQYARFTPERRSECMMKTKRRDPICHALMTMVVAARNKEAEVTDAKPRRAKVKAR